MKPSLMALIATAMLGLVGCVAEVPPDRAAVYPSGGPAYRYQAAPYGDRAYMEHEHAYDRDRGSYRNEREEHEERCVRDPDDCRRY